MPCFRTRAGKTFPSGVGTAGGGLGENLLMHRRAPTSPGGIEFRCEALAPPAKPASPGSGACQQRLAPAAATKPPRLVRAGRTLICTKHAPRPGKRSRAGMGTAGGGLGENLLMHRRAPTNPGGIEFRCEALAPPAKPGCPGSGACQQRLAPDAAAKPPWLIRASRTLVCEKHAPRPGNTIRCERWARLEARWARTFFRTAVPVQRRVG